MKRIALLATMAGFALFTTVASASPGVSGAARRASATKTEWTATYETSTFYGSVKCHGKTIVNKKYPGGKDIEVCEAAEGQLKNMTAGKEQHTFHGEGGIEYNEWESDSGDGARTSDYTYSVNKKLTRFKLVAIYPAS